MKTHSTALSRARADGAHGDGANTAAMSRRAVVPEMGGIRSGRKGVGGLN
jgi:hypothetical protein